MIRRIDNDGIKEYSRFLRTSFSTFLPVFILYLSCYDGNFLWCNSSDTLSFKMSAWVWSWTARQPDKLGNVYRMPITRRKMQQEPIYKIYFFTEKFIVRLSDSPASFSQVSKHPLKHNQMLSLLNKTHLKGQFILNQHPLRDLITMLKKIADAVREWIGLKKESCIRNTYTSLPITFSLCTIYPMYHLLPLWCHLTFLLLVIIISHFNKQFHQNQIFTSGS